jgi:hypothetical protein
MSDVGSNMERGRARFIPWTRDAAAVTADAASTSREGRRRAGSGLDIDGDSATAGKLLEPVMAVMGAVTEGVACWTDFWVDFRVPPKTDATESLPTGFSSALTVVPDATVG